jgi:hypothetical protein
MIYALAVVLLSGVLGAANAASSCESATLPAPYHLETLNRIMFHDALKLSICCGQIAR